MSGDATSDYPIYRLSALFCMAILLQTTICGALLCLAILQPTICGALRVLCLSGDATSGYLLYSACRYVSRWSRLWICRCFLLIGVPCRRLIGVLLVVLKSTKNRVNLVLPAGSYHESSIE
jgi:hypothetical protein